MKPDSILEEIWRIKDELGARHGFDVRKICDELRDKEAQWQGANPIVRSRAELQRLANASTGHLANADTGAMVLREEPPPPKT
jgi:hypothetical protein